MQKIHCDDCEKRKCPQRIEGSLCSLNREIQDIIVICESRDPQLMAAKMAHIMGSEMDRYNKATKFESIGEEIEMTYTNARGQEMTVRKNGTLDPKITSLAHSIIKNGKIINEILNPQKIILNQQNNQYNFGSPVARAISSLEGEDRVEAIKFLDERRNGTQ